MTKVRKKIGTIPINDIEQQVQQSTSAAITQMQQDVSDFIDEETAQYPEIGGTFKYIEDPEGRSEIKTDSEGKILSYRDSQGVMHENVGIESAKVSTNSLNITAEGMTEFQKALKDSGFQPGGAGDWSDYISNDGKKPIHIVIPKIAKINFITDPNLNLGWISKKGLGLMPGLWPAGVKGETYDIPVSIEFWDMQGNYFKKKCFISGQGASTLGSPKKNIAVDLFDDDWDGDAFAVRFGNWVSQDSFHLKAYTYEPFIGAGVWAYKIWNDLLKSRGPEDDYVWKKALLNQSENDAINCFGDSLEETEIFNDTGATCFPDGFPCVVYQNGTFWGVFSLQLKKHRDNYHMDKAIPEQIHLDGHLEGRYIWYGNIDWGAFEIRNPKNLVYATPGYDSEKQEYTYKYDADLPGQREIAGNADGSQLYDSWVNGTVYSANKIVSHNGHLFLNTKDDNSAEPLYHKKNNSDSSPDFKNKTGCNWLNVTNTVKVKEYIISLSKDLHKILDKEIIYIRDITNSEYWDVIGHISDVTEEYTEHHVSQAYLKDTLVSKREYVFKAKQDVPAGTALFTSGSSAKDGYIADIKTEFEKYFDVDNLIDYIIINDLILNADAFDNNWQWTTYDGVKWWCNLYDCNISFGYGGSGDGKQRFRYPISGGHLSEANKYMTRFILSYYIDELKLRWKNLRDSKVITPEKMYSIVKDWIDSIGLDNFNMENTKWGTQKAIDNMARIRKWIDTNILGGDIKIDETTIQHQQGCDGVYEYN